ncbi:hypothetical protein HHI36_000664 [Cryptolaemus montrouzieri]|uniref:TIR domain-containing protein n=1 Tax=Cryptolaemus montrouzieri TaxID=559131 RepID=A0ABD2P620_9CUCU
MSFNYALSYSLQYRQGSKTKIENSRLQRSFALHFFSLPMRKLSRLSLKSTVIDTEMKFDRIIAPNLTSLELEEIDIRIGAKMFRNHSQLLELNLSFNNIAYLEENVFENLFKLENLHLSKNNIEYLDNDLFAHLYNLRYLMLDFNDIENLNNETFKNLHKLNSLDLSNNNVLKVHRDVFRALTSIQHIFLDHNPGLELDDYLFSNFSKLEVVNLGHSNLKHLPETLFLGSDKITEILLENNHLESIPKKLFKGLTGLKTLKIHNNLLHELDGEIFASLGKLKVLELNHNEISGIDSDVFKQLVNLKELKLHNNMITYIKNDSFRYNQRLEKIYMANNKYEYTVDNGHYFSLTPFSSCLGLKYLDLSNNLVKDLPEDLFIYTKHLKNINLKNNRIESVDIASLWKIARKGVLLNVERNNITHFFFDAAFIPEQEISPSSEDYEDLEDEDSLILISNNPLNCDCYAESFLDLITNKMAPARDLGIFFKYEELSCRSPPDLNRIKFSEVSPMTLLCPLEEVISVPSCTSSHECQCSWRPYDKTAIVDCANKNLTIVPELLLPESLGFNQTEVHLENNNLKKAPFRQNGYNNVTRLYLSGNKIDTFAWIPPKVEVIDLSGNKIQKLTHITMAMMSLYSVRNITLGDNPWACGCEISNMTQFLRENVKKIDTQRIKCEEDGALIVNLSKSDICEDHTVFYLISVVVFSIILSVLLMGLAFYYKYRLEIKIWLYARNLCSTFLQEEELDKHKKYDVFISYSHKDEEFVLNDLLPELETGPYPYKVCLHYRDWIPGDFIADNIASSVVNSKRTLVVLTPNFLESVWGKMEFRAAHTEAMKERRNRVILVVKDDFDIDSVDDELKTYMRTNTYIRWRDSWFWEKLKYALPRKDRSLPGDCEIIV